MPDRLFGALDIGLSALSAEKLRMTVASENLANAGSTQPLENGLPYARQRVRFASVLDARGQLSGEVAAEVVASPRYAHRYDPAHPDADKNSGIVTTADIDPVLELTDLMLAEKAYEANANAIRGMMRMYEQTLRLGDG